MQKNMRAFMRVRSNERDDDERAGERGASQSAARRTTAYLDGVSLLSLHAATTSHQWLWCTAATNAHTHTHSAVLINHKHTKMCSCLSCERVRVWASARARTVTVDGHRRDAAAAKTSRRSGNNNYNSALERESGPLWCMYDCVCVRASRLRIEAEQRGAVQRARARPCQQLTPCTSLN